MDAKKTATPKKSMTKTEMIAALAESTGLAKKDVAGVFDELAKLIEKELGEEGAGTCNIFNLLKIKVVRKPATPERKGINLSRRRRRSSRPSPPRMWSSSCR